MEWRISDSMTKQYRHSIWASCKFNKMSWLFFFSEKNNTTHNVTPHSSSFKTPSAFLSVLSALCVEKKAKDVGTPHHSRFNALSYNHETTLRLKSRNVVLYSIQHSLGAFEFTSVLLLFSIVEIEHDRRGDEQRGSSSYKDTDRHDEREAKDRFSAEQDQCKEH